MSTVLIVGASRGIGLETVNLALKAYAVSDLNTSRGFNRRWRSEWTSRVISCEFRVLTPSAPLRSKKNDMVARQAVVVVALLAFSPALAENLDAEAARQFIVGKLFAFTCADGSRGAARVYDDGSVIGNVQFHGSERPQSVWLPAETLKLTGERVCASLNRTELCLALSKTSDQSFRASVTGLDFAYCDFTESVRIPDTGPRPEPSEPLPLDPR